MTQEDFFLYIKFFQYLDGKGEFTFQDFSAAYDRFKNWISGEKVQATEYLRDSEALLQFFFDVNVIGWRETMGEEHEKFTHFSFRERTLTNIAPKVKTTALLVVNPGVSKALDIGLRAQQSARTNDTPDHRRARGPRNKPGWKAGPPRRNPTLVGYTQNPKPPVAALSAPAKKAGQPAKPGRNRRKP